MKRANTGYIGLVSGVEIGTSVTAETNSKLVTLNGLPYGGRAYLVVVTSSEAGAGATLDITLSGYTHSGAATVTSAPLITGLTAPITANGTYCYLLGTDAATGGPATECFDFPLTEKLYFSFQVTGTTSSFIVNALLAFC
jgi:hypothetical protein